MTVPQITSHSAGISHRTRLVPFVEHANRVVEQKVTLRQVIDLADGLEIQIVKTQGRVNRQVEALSWAHSVTGDPTPAGEFPGRFSGTEAFTRDDAISLLNYLQATAPEAA